MNTIPIETPEDFECVCSDILDEFTNSFSFENGLIGYVNYHEGISYFSRRGEELYERYKLRLFSVGQRLFPGADMRIEAAWVRAVDETEGDYDDE